MQIGTHGSYKWLEADHDLGEFVSLCPNSIIGRHIVITALDSGSYSPSEREIAVGWSASGGIAYSPRLDSLAILPRDCYCHDCGFDEWYIFGSKPALLDSICISKVFEYEIAPPNVLQFINFLGFRLSDPQMKDIIDLFWGQMQWINPESYLGDGNRCLIFASSNHDLFGSVYETLSKSPSRNQD
jgi:hypothetical protein